MSYITIIDNINIDLLSVLGDRLMPNPENVIDIPTKIPLIEIGKMLHVLLSSIHK